MLSKSPSFDDSCIFTRCSETGDGLWFRDFALAYTNIAHIIADGYASPDEADGLFSGLVSWL
jgi:hypothetical protein